MKSHPVALAALEHHVTVSANDGVASSDAEKSLAGKLAESVRGVKSVDNAMTVAS